MSKYLKGYDSKTPPPYYDREPEYDSKDMIWEKDIYVEMRDGVRLCVDVCRPPTEKPLPVLLAYGCHNKDIQTPDASENSGAQPSWSSQWYGVQEGGDSRFLTSRGYIHVYGQPRGQGKSEDGGEVYNTFVGAYWDSYDLIEWIAAQPWCDGNVGMIGISAFGGAQFHAAITQPPHLKAIFPVDPVSFYSGIGLPGFHDLYPGGLFHLHYMIGGAPSMHGSSGIPPRELPPETEKLWRAAMDNPDYRMYTHMYSIITQRGAREPYWFDLLLNPYDDEKNHEKSEELVDKVKIPFYTGSGWHGYTYKQHIQGAQGWWANTKDKKNCKLMFGGKEHHPRPWKDFHCEILRWYDYWLKGIETGIMDEEPVKYWVMGANKWRNGKDWPLPETQWTKFYLDSWEVLREKPFSPDSRDGISAPDAFVQMPLTQTNEIAKLRYMTAPLPDDTLIAGPIKLKLFASIDQDDTSWIIILKDLGPDVSLRTGLAGAKDQEPMPERELTRGWLRASYHELDEKRTTEHRPFHKMTKEAVKKIVPGEIVEYDIEIISTANLFKEGHRICIDITCMDIPTGTAGCTNIEYETYHLCGSKTVLHKIYHDKEHPSYLLLPIIPTENDD